MDTNNWMHNRSLKIRFKKIVNLCKFDKNTEVLDVGCRDQDLKRYLPDFVKYNSVDINAKLDIIKVDLNDSKLPFKNNSFDYVFCLEVLEHIHSPFNVLSELKRVSNKYIIISVPNPYHYRDLVKHLLRMPDRQGHMNSFIYPNVWRYCKNLDMKIINVKGSFFLPFLPCNSLLFSRHMIFLLEK